MTTALKDVKVGTEVIFQFGTQEVRGHVIGHDKTLVLIGWKKDIAKQRGFAAWNIKEVIEKNFGHKPNSPVPNKYTDAWWVANSIDCKIISLPKQNSLGFLAACIVTGAGLSRVTSSTTEKTKVLKHASV